MIDIKFLRENPDIVKENIKKKFQDHKLPLVDEVIELDKERREVQAEADAIRAEKNQISKQIGALWLRARRMRQKKLRRRLLSLLLVLRSWRRRNLLSKRRLRQS
jgi:seryl-tRNA synthetase